MERNAGEFVEADINTSLTSGKTGGTGHSIEVYNLVNLIKGKQAEVHPSLSSDFFICRVPQKIREINSKAYEPRVVSIGPFHHGLPRYKSMEAFKMRSLNKVLQRSKGFPLENYVEFLKGQETSVRQSYSEIIKMVSDEFVTMLLLDGCFIIELLLCWYYGADRDVDYAILSSIRLREDIRMDLILIENQIPFFLLEGLFNLSMTGLEPIPLISLAISFFKRHNPQNKSHDSIISIKHFTDLLVVFHRPMSPSKVVEESQFPMTITELDEVGIKFKVSPSKCLLDVKFSKGVLEIPCIQFVDKTESVIRNMMALELCNYFTNSYMIDYMFFLDNLIDTPKDVDLLVQSGIIDNWLGDSTQLADFINNINVNMTVNTDNFKFSRLCKELNDYCKIPRHKWRATLKRDYFSTPWRSASTTAAIFLLALTLIQTILSIRSAARDRTSTRDR